MTRYGQVVVGPPGAGKTTYCHGIQQFMQQMGRDCAVVNLDFANEHVSGSGVTETEVKSSSQRSGYDCILDVRSLVSLERVMEEYELGQMVG